MPPTQLRSGTWALTCSSSCHSHRGPAERAGLHNAFLECAKISEFAFITFHCFFFSTVTFTLKPFRAYLLWFRSQRSSLVVCRWQAVPAQLVEPPKQQRWFHGPSEALPPWCWSQTLLHFRKSGPGSCQRMVDFLGGSEIVLAGREFYHHLF